MVSGLMLVYKMYTDQVRDRSVRTVAQHQSGVVADPGLVVAGSEVGESPHAVAEVEILLLSRHLHHHLQPHCSTLNIAD